jgi:hypothetical protein
VPRVHDLRLLQSLRSSRRDLRCLSLKPLGFQGKIPIKKAPGCAVRSYQTSAQPGWSNRSQHPLGAGSTAMRVLRVIIAWIVKHFEPRRIKLTRPGPFRFSSRWHRDWLPAFLSGSGHITRPRSVVAVAASACPPIGQQSANDGAKESRSATLTG